MPRNYSTNGVAWTDAKTLEAKARTRLLDLQHAKEAGELWDGNAVREFYGNVWGSLCSQLDELGPNLGPRVNPSDPVMASELISEAIRRIRTNTTSQLENFVPKANGKRGRQRAKMGKAR